MADKKDDLPGFYRDPKTGKYFRDKPEGTVNPSLKKLKKAKEEETVPNETRVWPPKIRNHLQYVRSNELGFVSGLNAEREYFKMRTRNKWKREEFNLNNFQSYNISSIDFLRGTRKSMLGVWGLNEGSTFRCVVGERAYIDTQYSPILGFTGYKKYVIDMCVGPNNTVVCIFNHPFIRVGSFAYLPQNEEYVDLYTSRFSSLLHSCASNQRGSKFALGCEGFIRFYNRTLCENTYFVTGRVHGVAFNESSSAMVSGVHSGKMYLHDIREKSLVMEIPVSQYCITDLGFIKTDQVIVGGAGNMLKKIDLRVQKCVTEYFGHKSSVKKRPFSIANDMLCVPGSDNTVRIWHVAGGHPVHEIEPIINPESGNMAWLYGDGSKTFLYQFEDQYQRIYDIR